MLGLSLLRLPSSVPSGGWTHILLMRS